MERFKRVVKILSSQEFKFMLHTMSSIIRFVLDKKYYCVIWIFTKKRGNNRLVDLFFKLKIVLWKKNL